MQDIKQLLLHKPWSYTSTMIWTACCLAFFGFLRVSEFTIPAHGQDQYDQSCHLSFNDVSLDGQDNPHMLKGLHQTIKKDPFCKGVDIYLGATGPYALLEVSFLILPCKTATGAHYFC